MGTHQVLDETANAPAADNLVEAFIDLFGNRNG
jgi:hypothetical protein